MTIFEEYETICNREFELRNKIKSMVEKYVDDHVGIVTEDDSGNPDIIDKTLKSEISWSLDNNNTIYIYYAPIANKYMDYWGDEKEIIVNQKELLKYE